MVDEPRDVAADAGVDHGPVRELEAPDVPLPDVAALALEALLVGDLLAGVVDDPLVLGNGAGSQTRRSPGCGIAVFQSCAHISPSGPASRRIYNFSDFMGVLTTAGRKARSAARVRARPDRHRAPAARPDHPDPPLQHRLRLLQRVRQGVAAGPDRRACSGRIDKLAELGTSVVAFSGGEPMLHPDLDDLIRHIRARGMMAGLITNGYFLVPKRIEELNDAGLDFLQISIDNVEPDEVSKKSLRVLDKKLQHLHDHADVRRQHQLGARRRHQEPRRRADDQHARARARLLHLDRHHPRRLGPAEAARAGRAPGVRRCVGRHQRAAAGRSRICTRGSRTSRRISPTASRTSGGAAPARATSTSAKTASSTTARSSAATRACRSSRTPSTTSSREFPTPKVVRALLHRRLRPPRVDDGFLAEPAATGRPAVEGQQQVRASGLRRTSADGGRYHLRLSLSGHSRIRTPPFTDVAFPSSTDWSGRTTPGRTCSACRRTPADTDRCRASHEVVRRHTR